MDPRAFQGDRFLRSSGYNLISWACVNSLFSLPAYAAAGTKPWSATEVGLYSIALLAAGVACSAVHERRVAKMLGRARAEAARFPAHLLWGLILLAGFAGTAALLHSGLGQYVQPLWLVAVGLAYLIWGSAAGLTLYAGLGLMLMAGGAVCALWQSPAYGAAPSVAGLHLWNLLMGALALAAGVRANRRYLWLSPPS